MACDQGPEALERVPGPQPQGTEEEEAPCQPERVAGVLEDGEEVKIEDTIGWQAGAMAEPAGDNEGEQGHRAKRGKPAVFLAFATPIERHGRVPTPTVSDL